MAQIKQSAVLAVGVTGHQSRAEADWDWTADSLRKMLTSFDAKIQGWTSLAIGADQLFATEILKLRGELVTVIPAQNYESSFRTEEDLEKYRLLLASSTQKIQLENSLSESAFFEAGKTIVRNTSCIIAIWDCLPAKGFGGTADVVQYARSKKKAVFVLNPVKRSSCQ